MNPKDLTTPAPLPSPLEEYTASDIHNSMNAVLNGLIQANEESALIRQALATLHDELRNLTSQVALHQTALVDRDGQSRLEQIRANTMSNTLHIRGLWSTISIAIAALASYVSSHMR